MKSGKARVRDVAEQVRGVSYGKTEAATAPMPGYISILRAGNITDEGLHFEDLVFVPKERVAEKQKLRRGDIVIAASSGSLDVVGKAASVTINFDGSFGAFCKVLRPNEKVDPGYFAHFFRTHDYRRRVSALAAGANINNLRNEHLDDLEIPLPPLPEQRRISAVLDKADELRAKRRAALVELDNLTQSVFLEIFGEKLTSPAVDTCAKREHTPRGCEWLLLTEVARLATGHTPDRERGEYWGGDVPWISLTDIRTLDGKVAQETLQNITALGIENSSAVLLPKGTVCFSRTASVGFVTVMGREMATSQDFMNWVCGPRIDPIYLMWALITSRKRLLAMSSGSTHRTIYMRIVEQFRVLLPQLSKQREFAQRITSIEALKAKHRTALAELDALFASLQSGAFGGEL